MIATQAEILRLFVPGQPVAKGRPRLTIRAGHARAFTPAKTVAYEGLIALAGQQAMNGHDPYECALSMSVRAIFQIPMSWSKRKRLDAIAGLVWHTSKPDGDNVLKAVGDGLNGIVWRDDSQLSSCYISKAYGATPGLDIRVEVLPA